MADWKMQSRKQVDKIIKKSREQFLSHGRWPLTKRNLEELERAREVVEVAEHSPGPNGKDVDYKSKYGE